MITKNNLKEVFNNLPQTDIEYSMDHSNDMVCLSVSIFNTGYIASLDPIEPKDFEIEESQGNLVCDKDDLLRLFKESGSNNPCLLEYC